MKKYFLLFAFLLIPISVLGFIQADPDIGTGAITVSGDVTAPEFSSASINGTTLTVIWTEACSQGASYSNSHINVDMSTTGTDISVTYSSGSGSDTWVFTTASAAINGETVDLDFDGTANSIEDGSGNDLGALSSESVTNSTPAAASPGTGPDYSQDANIVAWYRMEDDGVDEDDDSGNGNTLTHSATTGSIDTVADVPTGYTGVSRDFEADNVQGLYQVDGGDLDINGNQDFSIVGWFKVESTATQITIAAKYTTSGNNRQFQFAHRSADDALVAYVSSDGVNFTKAIGGTNTVEDGSWHHGTMLFDYDAGGSTLTILLDGSEDTNGASNPISHTGGIYNGAAYFCIGSQCSDSGVIAGSGWDGRLVDVGIFDRLLTLTEVGNIITYGINGFKGGLFTGLFFSNAEDDNDDAQWTTTPTGWDDDYTTEILFGTQSIYQAGNTTTHEVRSAQFAFSGSENTTVYYRVPFRLKSYTDITSGTFAFGSFLADSGDNTIADCHFTLSTTQATQLEASDSTNEETVTPTATSDFSNGDTYYLYMIYDDDTSVQCQVMDDTFSLVTGWTVTNSSNNGEIPAGGGVYVYREDVNVIWDEAEVREDTNWLQ